MITKNLAQTSVVNKRLWPACLNAPLSYEEQVQALIEKIKELEDRVTILEGKVNTEESDS